MRSGKNGPQGVERKVRKTQVKSAFDRRINQQRQIIADFPRSAPIRIIMPTPFPRYCLYITFDSFYGILTGGLQFMSSNWTAPGVDDGQGGLACCGSRGRRVGPH